MNKPAFNPNLPFEESSGGKPAFNPNQPFEESKETGTIQNAVQDLSDIGSGLKRIAFGVRDLPSDIYQSGKQVLSGGSFSETPLAQDARTVGGAVLGALPHGVNTPQGYRIEPGAIYRQYEELAAQPGKLIPGRIGEGMRQAYPENPLQKHPVNSALALIPGVKPLFGAAKQIPGVSKAITATQDFVAAPFQSTAQMFGRRALGIPKSQLNKLDTQLPQANKAAQTALDTGVIRNPILHPFSSSADDMMARAQALDTQAGQRIGSFLKSQGDQFDWGQTLDDLEQLKRNFPYDPDVINRINNAKDIIRKTAIRNGGEIPFTEANRIKTYIQNKVPWQSDKASAEVGQRSAGVVRGSLDKQLEKTSGSGPLFKEFKENKRLFGDSQIMQKGLLNKVSGESGNLPISPYSMFAGGAAFIQGGGLKAILATLGTEWVKRYGSATAATMSDGLAKLIKSNPQKYNSLLESAVEGGGAVLPAIENALKSDPQADSIISFPVKNGPRSKFKKSASLEQEKPEKLASKVIDEKTARAYLKKSGGDKEKARQLALADGWEVR